MTKTRETKKILSKNNIDDVWLIVVFLMLALGLIMVMSASAPTAISEGKSCYAYVKTQAISAALGLFAMFVISKIDYRVYKGFYKIIYVGVILLNLAVIVVGKDAGRSKKMDKIRFYEFSTI